MTTPRFWRAMVPLLLTCTGASNRSSWSSGASALRALRRVAPPTSSTARRLTYLPDYVPLNPSGENMRGRAPPRMGKDKGKRKRAAASAAFTIDTLPSGARAGRAPRACGFINDQAGCADNDDDDDDGAEDGQDDDSLDGFIVRDRTTVAEPSATFLRVLGFSRIQDYTEVDKCVIGGSQMGEILSDK